MTNHCMSWQVRALVGTVLLWAVFHQALGFASSSPPQSATVHLRGSELRHVVHGSFHTREAGKTRAVFAPPLLGVVGLVALVGAATAAAAKVSRRVTSRIEWYRKVKRVGGTTAVFDVTIPKPLGLKIENFTQKGKEGAAGISLIQPNGNADKVNRKVCVDDVPGSGMWVLEGDKIVAVNGVDCEDGNIDKIVELIVGSEDEVSLTLSRNTRLGPIKVVMLPEGFMTTVRRGARLSSAAEAAAGRELKYGCIDGWCVTCWHRERTTDGIFKPCCDQLTGDWDNVMPLVLTPKPEKAGDSTLLNPRGA